MLTGGSSTAREAEIILHHLPRRADSAAGPAPAGQQRRLLSPCTKLVKGLD